YLMESSLSLGMNGNAYAISESNICSVLGSGGFFSRRLKYASGTHSNVYRVHTLVGDPVVELIDSRSKENGNNSFNISGMSSGAS
ncbi:452_t:CDS:2, partial [Gigaspora rosea]